MDETTPSVSAESTEQASVAEATEGTQEATGDQDTGGESTPASTEVDIASIDPATLAPELQDTVKSFQADYTRKMQEIAEVKNQATAFQELVSHPEFKGIFENLQKFGTVTAPQAEANEASTMTPEQKLEKFLSDPDGYIQEAARELVKPLAEREAQRESDSVIERLSAKYPDFKEYGDEISEKIAASGYKMDPEDAYKAVAFDKAKQAGINEGMRAAQARAEAATTRGSAAPAVSQKAIKSIHDAFQAAKKAHGQA